MLKHSFFSSTLLIFLIMKKLALIILLSISVLHAQSLMQDASRLAEATAVLQDNTNTPTAQARALGGVVATLWFYDNPRGISGQLPNPQLVLQQYQDNNTITSLLGNSIPLWTDSMRVFKRRFIEVRDSMSSGPRKKILELLYAERATDPAEYLSLLKTMHEYQEPPLDAISALQAPAVAQQESGSGGGIGLFNEAAIIRGLFSFLVERAGEELVITFLDRLLGKELPTVAKLFPTVITLYSNTDYAYSDSFLASLREAFIEDLQLLDVRLPDLLLTDDLFAELQADPVFYSMLTVYQVAAITKQGDTPVEQAVPLVARSIYQRYQDTEKQRNLLLADNAFNKPEYQRVITAAQEVVTQSQAIFADIEVAEEGLNTTVKGLMNNRNINFGLRRAMLRDVKSLKSNIARYNGVFKAQPGADADYDLLFVPSLLGGKLPASLMRTVSTLESYDKYFSKPVSPQNRRAAGLALTRRMAGEEFGTVTLDQYFSAWRDTLILYSDKVLAAQLAAQTESNLLQTRKQQLELDSLTLINAIETTEQQWQGILTSDEASGLLILKNILQTLGANLGLTDANAAVRLTAKENKFSEIRERLATLHTRIVRRLKGNVPAVDPLKTYFTTAINTVPYQGIEDKIIQLGADLETLRKALNSLDNAYAKNLSRSHANAQPLMQMSEVLSYVFYLLRSDAADTTAQRFINIHQLQDVLLNAPQRKAFLGLMEQDLGHIQHLGTFSRDGLEFLVEATVQDLDLLPTRVNTVPDSLKFYQESAFVINTMNRLLETPLLIDPLQPDSVYSLTQKWSGLALVPEVSRGVLDLVFYISTKNYRQAITKTLETTIHLTKEYESTFDSKSTGKQRGLVQFIQQYGGFIGGMVDADSASQVQALLNAFADPPGSSRIKRQRPFTAGINAYVGGLYGVETLGGNDQATEQTFNTFAPSIPIGATFSFLVGPKYAAHRPSFSLFFSVIDLGSLATFNLSEDLDGDNQLTFRNVLKPGFQLQWNIPKSPFFLGTGAQYGPHYRQFGEELLGQRSTRYFVSFGIDIVVKRFY